MTNESDSWHGFWIGQQPTLTICVTYDCPIGRPEEGWHRFLLEAVASGRQLSLSFESKLGELKAFGERVRAMYETLNGSARFESVDSNVIIEGTMDRFGHVFWNITLRSPDGGLHELRFLVEEDQTLLWNVHAKIDDMLEAIVT